MNAILQALKSKTVWAGIATEVWATAQVFLADGVFTTESIVSFVTGAVIIGLRIVTTTPLSEK